MKFESQIETSMSTFRRYQSVFGNYDLETGNSNLNIKVTAFDIDFTSIRRLCIDLNVNIGGGKVPDAVALHARKLAIELQT